jgi:hypothetical protein
MPKAIVATMTWSLPAVARLAQRCTPSQLRCLARLRTHTEASTQASTNALTRGYVRVAKKFTLLGTHNSSNRYAYFLTSAAQASYLAACFTCAPCRVHAHALQRVHVCMVVPCRKAMCTQACCKRLRVLLAPAHGCSSSPCSLYQACVTLTRKGLRK